MSTTTGAAQGQKTLLGGATSRFARKLNHSVSRVRDASGYPSDILSPEHIYVRLFEHIGFPDSADALAYDPSQGLLAVATSDGCVKLIGRKGVEVTVCTAEKATVSQTSFLCFLKNRGSLLRVSADGEVQLLNVARGQVSARIRLEEENVNSVAIVPRAPYAMIGCASGNCFIVEITKSYCSAEDRTTSIVGSGTEDGFQSGLKIQPYKSKTTWYRECRRIDNRADKPTFICLLG